MSYLECPRCGCMNEKPENYCTDKDCICHRDKPGERTDTERLDHLENEVDREMRDLNPKGHVSLFRRNVPITRESIDDDMEVPHA